MSWRSVQEDGRSLIVGVCGGRPWAIEDSCSHAGCAFSTDGEIIDGIAICNCHGSEFDVFTGQVLNPPAHEPIDVFPVRMVNGQPEVIS